MGKWTVQQGENSNHTCAILAFLLEEFCRVFGFDIMLNEDCVVYNDMQAECPRFNHTNPLSIRLHQSNLTFWSQTIFQLSHEMCHYAMHQKKIDRTITLSWFEEIVCEAVSLYALEYASKEWHRCQLSKFAPEFFESHKCYLEDELNNEFTDEFKQCDSVERLKEYENQGLPENRRETHRFERNIIYKTISADPLELKYVLNYTGYIEDDGITIDFSRWIQESPCVLLEKLKEIQPVKFGSKAL